MKIIAVIPAHMDSVRFPGKILYPLYDLPMIEHVRRRALLSEGIDDVIIATCDDDIAAAVKKFGGKVVMTADTHKNGTTRVAEAISDIECSHVILLQGDEPLLLPRHIDKLAAAVKESPNGDAWNATGSLEDESELDRHSFVKCLISSTGRIITCFRRGPCFSDFKEQRKFIRKILGIIAYRKDFLMEITKMPSSPIELAEFIEQMRIIENDFTLQSVPVEPSLPSVNEPDEVNLVFECVNSSDEQSKLLDAVIKGFK